MVEGLKKSPHWPDVGGGGLSVGALAAKAEGLAPRVGLTDPRRGPVDVLHESSKPLQVVMH